MIDIKAERLASLERQGIDPPTPTPRCPCGEPIAHNRRKYCSRECLRVAMDESMRSSQFARSNGLTTATERREARNRRIIEEKQTGRTAREIGEEYGLSPSAIYRIVNSRTSPIRNHRRITILLDRKEVPRWQRCAGDRPLRDFVLDLVQSEVERRYTMLASIEAARQG